MEHVLSILQTVTKAALSLNKQLNMRSYSSDAARIRDEYGDAIWTCVFAAREISTEGLENSTDMVLLQFMIEHVTEFNRVVGERSATMARKLNLFQWGFMEFLALLALFGVLLIRTGSYKLDLVFVFITIFSVALLCFGSFPTSMSRLVPLSWFACLISLILPLKL